MSTRTLLGVTTASMLTLLSACSAPPIDAVGAETSREMHGPAAGATKGGATAAAGSGSSYVDLGDVATGAPITFTVPAGTIGFSLVVDGNAGESVSIGVQELHDPSGASVIANFLDVAHPLRFDTGPIGAGYGVVSFPRVSDDALAPIPAGAWTGRFGGSVSPLNGAKGAPTTPWSGRVHASVRFQTTSDGTFHGGAIDLDLYVPAGLRLEGRTIDATSAATDAALASRIAAAFDLFHRLYGFDRGVVHYHPIEARWTSVVGQEAALAVNRLATAVNDHPVAQVILTNVLDPDGDGGTLSGLTNCLPGAVGIPGTGCSAIIVAVGGGPAFEDGATLVHELGHFMGLDHTTELAGDRFDSLSDTPQCHVSSGKSFDFATCPDHTNLMFPTNTSADAEALFSISPTQRAVVRGTSLYRVTRP